jgi:RNA polymerase sigma factor (sigma-70 family)
VTDLQLALAAQSGDQGAADALVRRHTGLAYGIADDFYLPGSDRDDTRQEALLGLVAAIRGYRPERGHFPLFARLLINRRLITVLKQSQALKHRPVTESARHARNEFGDLVPIVDLLPARQPSPHEQIVLRAELSAVVGVVKHLSPLERRALVGFANGASYADIEARHGRLPGEKPKWVDNAVQRARRKVRTALAEAA